MIDLLASAAVVAGGVLALLAGVGLLRFPDVFTRIHAATKAATIGVILTTLAAAAEVDTADAVGVLVLVVALLFLSSPLGTSLLARAAYHDPETPRAAMVRDDLAAARDVPEQATGGDDRGAPTLLVGWLIVVWIVLFAAGSPGVLLGAVVVAAVVSLALPGFRPRWPQGVFRPVAFLRLSAWFTASVAMSNVDVIRAVVSRRPPRPAIVLVPLRVRARTEVTLFMNAISFTPGTLAVELHGTDLYVHILDLTDPDAFIAQVRRLESLIIDTFGTPDERAGTVVSPPRPPDRGS